MTIKITDLTKKSKWKLTAEVQSYKIHSPYSYKPNARETGDWAQILDKKFFGPLFPADTEFMYVAKPSSYCRSDDPEYLGQMLEVVINEKTYFLAFVDVKEKAEMVDQPTDLIYLIRDTATGWIYKGVYSTMYDYKNGVAVEKPKPATVVEYPGKNDTYIYNPITKRHDPIKTEGVEIEFAKTPGSGKTLKNIGQAKQRLLFIVGYYNELGDSAPGMLSNPSFLTEIPTTWEVVSYDKVSKTYTSLFNAKEYVDSVNRLKVLTLKYGSAVRELYKTLEKKNELESFTGFLLFSPGDLSKLRDDWHTVRDNDLIDYGNSSPHDGGYYLKIIDSEIKLVKDLLDKSMRKSIQKDSCAIAVATVEDAVLLKLRYTGRLKCSIIDMTTLNETVEA